MPSDAAIANRRQRVVMVETHGPLGGPAELVVGRPAREDIGIGRLERSQTEAADWGVDADRDHARKPTAASHTSRWQNAGVRLSDVDDVTARLDGVHRAAGEPAQWRYHGRLVARALDQTHVVIRADFEFRDVLVHQFPETFSVPTRFRSHMMVVADLESGDPDAIEDALVAAWQLQRSP